MNNRQRFVAYVRDGGEPFASVQIGAGAGFDAKVLGKQWLSEVTLMDTLSVCERFDMLPLINTGPLPYEAMAPRLAWHREQRIATGRREYTDTLSTPYGELIRRTVEEPIRGGTPLRYPVTGPEGLDALCWYIETALKGDFSRQTEHLAGVVKRLEGRAALSVQWGMQPYELLSFANTVDTVMMALDAPGRFREGMELVVALDEQLCECCAQAGVDFALLGGPGAEMLSPAIYEEFIVPYSQRVTDMAHEKGLLIYSHICSPIEPFLTMGCYGRMGIDLFETLSAPPVGNIKSLPDALSKLPEDMCTRGNVGLDLMLTGTPDQVYDAARQVLRDAAGRKHMLAASDYLFYDIPEACVEALCRAAKDHRGG